LWNLAQSLWYQYDYEAAEMHFREALAIRREIYGREHHLLAASVSRLGLIFSEVGQWARAYPYFQEAADIQEEILGIDHPRTARARALLGDCLSRMGRFEEGEPILLDALSKLKDAKDSPSTYLDHVLKGLVQLYTAWGKPDRVHEYQAMLDSRAGGIQEGPKE
jgi:tetratricopeptide (TPR) repeat protein